MGVSSHSIISAIQYRLIKEDVFVPNTHPVVTTAVRATEYALAHGITMKIAVAFGVNSALSNDSRSRQLVGL